ncbi:MAG: mechanosensitive ion channel family protein, partial [bacterium]
MIFDLWINIVLTILILFVIVGIYMSVNTYMTQENRTLKKWVILLLYVLLFIVVLGGFGFGLYIWGIPILREIKDIWSNIGDIVVEKIGAIIGSILVVIISMFIIRLFKFLVLKSKDRLSTKNDKRKHTIIKITSSIVNYAVKIIGLLILLSLWGINVLPALAGLGILGLVVGLGAQDLIKDIIAGFFIVFENHFDVGDLVEVDGFKGEVIDIGLKTTKIKNWKEDVKIFNNAAVQKTINYSITESIAIIDFGIGYDADIDKVIDLLKEELPKMREIIPEAIE